MTSKQAPLQFGGYFHPFPQGGNIKVIEKAEETLHRPIDLVMWYQQWGAVWPGRTFHPRWVRSVGHRDILLKWEPYHPWRGPAFPMYSLENIAAGKYDGYIKRWATAIRRCEKQIYLCPLSEMNGFWFHWSKVVGKHEPAAYVTAWRHLHQVFADCGATNVRWVWGPNAGDVPDDNRMEDYYPGNDYVDVLGLSVYNWGTAKTWSHWRSFEEIFQPYYERIGMLGDQPIWITEMGCAPVGGDKAEWIRMLWHDVPRYPRLCALQWFNIDKETDWRVTEDPEMARAFWP